MITLVRCLVYPETNLTKAGDKPVYLSAKDFFPDPVLNDEFRLNASPNEVLNQTLHTHYLEGYLGIKPWTIDVSKRKGYLDISEIEGKRVDGTITDLLGEEGFSVARRQDKLNTRQISGLVSHIMEGLNSDNMFGVFVSRKDTSLSSRVYADVLRALGREVTQEQIEQMFSAQYRALEDYVREQRQRDAENWSILGHQVVGAEVL